MSGVLVESPKLQLEFAGALNCDDGAEGFELCPCKLRWRCSVIERSIYFPQDALTVHLPVDSLDITAATAASSEVSILRPAQDQKVSKQFQTVSHSGQYATPRARS